MSPEMEKLIGKAVTDASFRDELFDKPEQAMKDFNLTNDERKQVKEGVKSRTTKGKAIGGEIDALRSEW